MTDEEEYYEEEEEEEGENPNPLGVYEGDRNPETKKREGKGKNTFVNGDVYEGEYVNGARQGAGTYTFKKGKATYTGQYRDNKKEGNGKFTYPDGGEYTGTWIADKRQGQGLYKYPNGDTYEGG